MMVMLFKVFWFCLFVLFSFCSFGVLFSISSSLLNFSFIFWSFSSHLLAWSLWRLSYQGLEQSLAFSLSCFCTFSVQSSAIRQLWSWEWDSGRLLFLILWLLLCFVHSLEGMCLSTVHFPIFSNFAWLFVSLSVSLTKGIALPTAT